MPAPGKRIHLQQRRIGHLHHRDLVAWDRADRRKIEATRQDVEGIEDDPDFRPVGAAHDLPGVAIVEDMPPPGQRLVADAQAPPSRTLAKLGEIGGEPVDAGQGFRRDAGADEEQVGAQFLQEIELAFGPVEDALAAALGHALEIAEGLAGHDVQPVIGADTPDFRWRAGKGDQVVLEDLDGLESGGRDGFQLLLKRARDADGGDRWNHGMPPLRPVAPRRANPRPWSTAGRRIPGRRGSARTACRCRPARRSRARGPRRGTA